MNIKIFQSIYEETEFLKQNQINNSRNLVDNKNLTEFLLFKFTARKGEIF